MKRLWLFIPLAIIMAIVGIAFVLYNHLEYEQDSPMVGKKIPAWHLLDTETPEKGAASFDDKLYVLHLGSSWCETCLNEHQYILELAETGVPVVGIFYKDKLEDVQDFLTDKSNPYERIVIDEEGRAMVHLGALSLPSTYIVDEKGTIIEVISGPLQSTHQARRHLP